MKCFKCHYEIEEDEPVYCDSCFSLLLEALSRMQNEIKNLKEENFRLKAKLDIINLEGKRAWKKKRR